jgi:hypothetical protein
MKNLAKALCLSVLFLGLSPSTVMAASSKDTDALANDKPIYLISVVTLKGDKVNRALRKTLKKIAQTATMLNGESLGDFALKQPLDRKLTLVVRLPSNAKLSRFQQLADPHYVRLRKSVETEYRFLAVAPRADEPQNLSGVGPFIKIKDIKGQYPIMELLLSQE